MHCIAWIIWMSAFCNSYSCHHEPCLRHSFFSIDHLWARLSWMDGTFLVVDKIMFVSRQNFLESLIINFLGRILVRNPEDSLYFFQSPNTHFSIIHSPRKDDWLGIRIDPYCPSFCWHILRSSCLRTCLIHDIFILCNFTLLGHVS